mmetsp:Transcript_122433/g.228840  ORF Transcript_122433/g.228840 Transcript_122433/m.228840 type:complete len:190 (-) Transcript_122433:14-583(-)
MAELRICPAEPLREWPLTASPSARARLARPAPVSAAGAVASVVQVTPLATPVSRRSSAATALQTLTPAVTTMQSAGAASPSVSSARACVRQSVSWAEVVHPVRTPVATSVPLNPGDMASPSSDGTFRAQPASVQVQISAASPIHSNQAHTQASPSLGATVLRGSLSTPVLPITGDESALKARIVRLHKR